MSGVNPVVLLQLMNQYHQLSSGKSPSSRTFVFNRNNLLRVHKETEEEVKRRKSQVSPLISATAEETLMNSFIRAMKGRIGKVWIDPTMAKIAVPLDISTGESGYGVLPSGSRIGIEEGKKVRAFTYWEKVNDIDLSCFGLTEDGRQEEFSWRNMYRNQGDDICFSGDQTSGYNGGSEYFDIRLDKFSITHPKTRYLIFCNNVFSGVPFKECICTAGFMMRDTMDSGEVFEPKTVKTSFKINCDSTFAYLFAIDLERWEMIWLNLSRKSNTRVAGSTQMDFLEKYLTSTDVMDVAKLLRIAGTPVESVFGDWEVAFTDMQLEESFLKGREVIHSWDTEKILRLLNPA